nr:Gfo/Idh/MocA family oxidoreductase [Paenibacillus sp. N3.4]
MSKKIIRFGVIGCGLMGKEFASAAARWCHLTGVDFEPKITAVCDANEVATQWFKENIPSVEAVYTDYKELLADSSIAAVYCAVPHNLHAQIYVDIIESGKHLLGEKPFGIDQAANLLIQNAIAKHPQVIVRCSSEFPFFLARSKFINGCRSVNLVKLLRSKLVSGTPAIWIRRKRSIGKGESQRMANMDVWAIWACMFCIFRCALAGNPNR